MKSMEAIKMQALRFVWIAVIIKKLATIFFCASKQVQDLTTKQQITTIEL